MKEVLDTEKQEIEPVDGAVEGSGETAEEVVNTPPEAPGMF